MDLLSDVLLSLRVESTIISSWHLTAPWGVAFRDFEPPWCLILLEGNLWFEPGDGEPPQLLQVGDAVLAPRGGECRWSSSPEQPCTTLTAVWQRQEGFHGFRGIRAHEDAPGRVEFGGGGEATRLMVVGFQFRQSTPLKLLEELPEFITVRSAETALFPGMRPAMDLLTAAPGKPHPGYAAVATHLAELVFISLLRAHILTQPQLRAGWLRGLTDPKIGKALSAIHAAPARAWSVTCLAAEAGMSRSAFAERFTRLVGHTPADYLNDWRIRLAVEALRADNQPLAVLAESLGFQSDRVFRRAFKRFMGISPLRYRRALRSAS